MEGTFQGIIQFLFLIFTPGGFFPNKFTSFPSRWGNFKVPNQFLGKRDLATNGGEGI